MNEHSAKQLKVGTMLHWTGNSPKKTSTGKVIGIESYGVVVHWEGSKETDVIRFNEFENEHFTIKELKEKLQP